MKAWIFAAVFLISSSLFGILPPLAQSSRELQAILSDSRTLELLGSAALLHSVVKVKDGYLLMTRDSILQVDVEYLPSSRMGPASFALHFHEPMNITSFSQECY